MKKIFAGLAIFLALLLAAALIKYPQKNFARVEIQNVSIRAEIVDNPFSRMRGLAGRDTLKSGEGMLFVFDSPGRYGMWMKGMLFPIDILWLGQGRVLEIAENASPPSAATSASGLEIFRPNQVAEYALEVPAGFIASERISTGDRVQIIFPKK